MARKHIGGVDIKIILFKFKNNEFIKLGTTQKMSNDDYSIMHYEVGEFHFTIPLNAKYANYMVRGIFININDEFWGRIENFEDDYTSGLKTVYGFDLKSLMTDRQVIPTDYTSTDGTAGYMTVTGSTEYCIKYLVDKNVCNPPQAGRAYPNMVILPNLDRGLPDDKYMARFVELEEPVKKLCETGKLGYKLWIDAKTNILYFDVYEGVDRTTGQNQNSRAVFSVNRKNMAKLIHSETGQNYRNAFYVTKSGAEFEDEALTLLYYKDDQTVTGFDRREKHITVSVDSLSEEYEEMKWLADKSMGEFDIEKCLTCELSPRNGYKKVWDVGDMVTVIHEKYGFVADMQITGVLVTESAYTIKFGKQKPKYRSINNQLIKI